MCDKNTSAHSRYNLMTIKPKIDMFFREHDGRKDIKE